MESLLSIVWSEFNVSIVEQSMFVNSVSTNTGDGIGKGT